MVEMITLKKKLEECSRYISLTELAYLDECEGVSDIVRDCVYNACITAYEMYEKLEQYFDHSPTVYGPIDRVIEELIDCAQICVQLYPILRTNNADTIYQVSTKWAEITDDLRDLYNEYYSDNR